MKNIASTSRASFLTLIVTVFGWSVQASVISERTVGNPNPVPGIAAKFEPAGDLPHYRAGVLIGDYLSVIFIYLLVLILRNLRKMNTSGFCIHHTSPCEQTSDRHVHKQIPHCNCPAHGDDQVNTKW